MPRPRTRIFLFYRCNRQQDFMILAQSPFWDFAKWDSGGTPDKRAVYIQRRILLLSFIPWFHPKRILPRHQNGSRTLGKSLKADHISVANFEKIVLGVLGGIPNKLSMWPHMHYLPRCKSDASLALLAKRGNHFLSPVKSFGGFVLLSAISCIVNLKGNEP